MSSPRHQRSRSRHLTHRYRPTQRRSVVVLVLLLLLWSLGWGIGLAQAVHPPAMDVISTDAIAQSPPAPTPTPSPASNSGATNPGATNPGATNSGAIGTVDVVPSRYKLGQELYLGTCATCHIGLPPAVMPTETWRQLLQDSQHYGTTLTPLTGPSLRIVWDYLRQYSRPQSAEEEVPYRIYQSKIFRSLHPRVNLPPRPQLTSCVSCHPGAGKYDFRSLSAEWQNAP